MDTLRCVGCGKVIETGTKLIRIETGKLNQDNKCCDTSEWGSLHVACFESSIESPSLALAKIKKLAKTTKVISRGKKS